ncbi:MAG TPA: M15 family metallopeptidase [Ktedonobacteraceae bacterium]
MPFPTFPLQPIPPIKAPIDWKTVTIHENSEPLVTLSALDKKGILIDAQYFQMGLPHAQQELYAREGAVEKLIQAAALLPAGYALLIWDAWRPLAVQQALFDAQYQMVREQFPSLSEQEVQKQVQIYVCAPSDNISCPSLHYTGGAIDLTIVDATGSPLPMGTAFDTFDSRSRSRALEEQLESGRQLTEEEQAWLENRRLLYCVMTTAGFTYDWEEWWHFDYGNQPWGAATGKNAIYNGIG